MYLPINLLTYQAAPDSLKNRVILVTGAGDGIGRAAAVTYAKHGATVLLLGRTLSKLEAVYDEIEQQGGAQPALLPLNLSHTKLDDYLSLLRTIEKKEGRLDGILHNAALLGPIMPLQSYDPETWDEVMNVNLRAPFQLTQALLPLLSQSNDASVVFTTSSVGRSVRPLWGAYAISKQGVEGLSCIFADELSDTTNIRFNCLNPGATRTSMRASAFPDEDPMTLPMPEQIMPAYLYLMGEDSKGVTGQSLDVPRIEKL
jgi:NAD(P)-dependent dehydrogenase (short-subunit alcohol dehydrogenase family)